LTPAELQPSDVAAGLHSVYAALTAHNEAVAAAGQSQMPQVRA